MDSLNQPKIYFFTCPEIDNYQDDIIPLAEGLKELGIEYFALNNYWLQSEVEGDYLFKATPEVHFTECDIVVFPHTWFQWYKIKPVSELKVRDFPKDLFASGRKFKTVYFDVLDGYQTVSWGEDFRKFDLILRAKLNSMMPYPSNMKPWVHGFSNRVIRATSESLSPAHKKYEIISNFGASHPFEHPLRRRMRIELLPKLKNKIPINNTVDDLSIPPDNLYDRLMWQQTTYRHSPSYFERLNQTLLSSAFCGDLVPSYPYDPHPILVGGNKAKIKRYFYENVDVLFGLKKQRLVQWDSFRFWETLVAGSVPIHIDIEKHGVTLPVMPENFKHYVGLDIHQLDKSMEFLFDNRIKLEQIAVEGRQWAFNNYSPKIQAERFLNLLK